MSKIRNVMKNIKRGDILLTVCLLAVGLTAALVLPLLASDGMAVSVEVDGSEVAVYRLDGDARVLIDPDGDGKDCNVLVIKGGKAFIESADCPDGICTAHPPVSKEGETIVCLPHRLVIRVIGDRDR